ncbi:ATP-binding protein [Paenibacillus sp. SYP-B3998]|uniref:ATP-binding protein n=1 Tax=Paenibacillus sp. SYP-B3998 TaxID=2678564 RepID=A0A6G3ZSS5_9BACL|nr:AAA family ATPase [Paenibacillus sp. SYP-B3998]NEW05110.1 ATP-binding protein [Paenibacillus sp. SYP-B3998]
MPKLVFFLGPAAAGKTTLAKAIVAKRPAAFLDMDTLSRPAAETIMRLSGLDPNDRDSPIYKQHCRDLGYRITMDAALENVGIGVNTYVVGPFTKEIADPLWLEQELSRAGASLSHIAVKAIYVYLPDEHAYRLRLAERGSVLDAWKLENWAAFSPSLERQDIQWPLPASAKLYVDNSDILSDEKLSMIEGFIYGGAEKDNLRS